MMKLLIRLFQQPLWLGGLLFLLVSLFAFPGTGQAFTFNKNSIITNLDLTDSRSMTPAYIQSFIRNLGGVLGQVRATDSTGVSKTAGQLILEASQRYKVNPKVFLVMIEKEMGLVRSVRTWTSSTQWRVDHALGYACPDSTGCSAAGAGFARQVDKFGSTVRKYLTDLSDPGRGYQTISGWAVGRTKTTLDGISVTPQNQATASLYTYNPWVGKYGGGDPRWGANSLFAKLWDEWFKIRFPDGSLLRVEGEAGVWLIKDGKRHPFKTRSAFTSSYDFSHVVDVPLSVLQAYPLGTGIKYPEFSLLQAPSGGIYLLADNKKRPIPSREIFNAIGFHPEEIIPVTWPELSFYPNGEPVSKPEAYPTGVLLQSRETGGIAYIENGIRHAIWSREILQNRFKYRTWKVVSQKEIERYPVGDPVKFKDGEIVTSPNANGVYFISNGEKRGIPSPAVFQQLGLKWSNLIRTTDAALRIHPTGQRINFESQN